MKATGIVRRIDELGRVVIPKEIRSTLRLKSGDPLEIFTDHDELMLKKYSPIASLDKFSEGTAKSLSDLSGHIAVICDTDEVLHASGRGQRMFDGKSLSEKMEKILNDYLEKIEKCLKPLPVSERVDIVKEINHLYIFKAPIYVVTTEYIQFIIFESISKIFL